ncbi:short-chain dehydrogenase reductase sdr [Leptolyngbya sp. Heron Island J]|uniref:SDR family NAD(P)-dependent oxidoreductase n=1 Tax=Leptolyngbya sp. Heron Island J TaxID=1385935 RepID=UPI0003B9BD6B|nr:SDR family oxidoreductase [Leptolyngbya sp. Heron Island J]ESA36397.1 short-chain dehydrogenase reductase sdr [Leptolyngbya sp. Heron Island J]
MRLDGKVSLITGAGSGIGRATANCFAQEGAIVVAVDVNADAAQATEEAIEMAGGQCLGLGADVSDEEQVIGAIAATVKNFGRLDILFNNAGISVIKPITETTEADLDKLLGVNLKGVFFGCKHGIVQMLTQGGGIIINTASELGIVGQPLYSGYSATKGGVLALTRTLAAEWSAQNIRINAICPGPTDTPMIRAEFNLSDDPVAEEKAAVSTIPAGHLGKPEDIARVALFLATSDADFVHGAAIVADGGKTIR